MPVTPISLGVRSNVGRDTAISAAKLVNCYPEDAGEEGKIKLPIVACDGFTLTGGCDATALSGVGAIRHAGLALSDTALYFVAGPRVVKWDGSGSPSLIGAKTSTVTITIASPGAVTWTAHGLAQYAAIAIGTTGALPTGLTADTTYYVRNPTTNTFQLSATPTGSVINTSGSQSGTHTAVTSNFISASGLVTMARNRKATTPQIGIVGGSSYYIVENDKLVDYTGLITSLGSEGSLVSISTLDGYAVLPMSNGEFFLSSIDEWTAIDTLDFSKAESNADGLKRGVVRGRDALLFGPNSIEGWINTGATDFPFERSSTSDIGCYAAGSVVPMVAVVDGRTVDTVIWAATNSDGGYAGIMVMTDGLTGQKISTSEIDTAIKAVSDPTTIRAFAHSRGDHVFYTITDLSTFTYSFDTTLGFAPHQRTSSGLNFWRIGSAVVLGSKALVGDYTSAKLYWTKSGLYDNANDSVLTVKHSNDNGDTWVATRTLTLSGSSNRKQRAKITRLGQSKEDGKVLNIAISKAVMEDGTANDMIVQPPAVHAWPNPMRFSTLYVDTVPGVSQTSRSKAISGLAVDAVALRG